MKKVQIPSVGDVAKAFRNADENGKRLLKDLYGEDVCEITPTLVKSYEDACEVLGIVPMDEAEMLLQGFRQDEIDRRKLETITFALNGSEHLDWNNADQTKWLPYFNFKAPSGFAFDDTRYWRSYAAAGHASHLCFKSEELARYAGQTFTDLYRSIIDNKPSK